MDKNNFLKKKNKKKKKGRITAQVLAANGKNGLWLTRTDLGLLVKHLQDRKS
jgi:hypothetical protein